MAYIYKNRSKATLCSGRTCVTVYDEAAKFVEGLVVTTVTIIAIALLAKALK